MAKIEKEKTDKEKLEESEEKLKKSEEKLKKVDDYIELELREEVIDPENPPNEMDLFADDVTKNVLREVKEKMK